LEAAVKKPLVAALFVAFTVATPFAQSITQPSPVDNFVAATRDYVAMHRRLEQVVGPITLSSSAEQINRSVQALAAAIRSERPGAQQGELFTPALGRELRARVAEALVEHGFTPDDILASQLVEGVNPKDAHLRVNATFPWILASAMFPCVIQALPPLPPELQYRIVGTDLVLIDVHASLVVDILPDVLGSTTIWDLEKD
jgi:hypothetical protein